ncbi:murein biosynthesis integral membrane protein MurJ [Oceanobacillus massiliensis]|uniref:murein biosynthesis integral membrane protein MurJ n=1 Tax=Oceanobacillus massiliensis TaxID=1465765 RepID=UPI0030162B56
MKSKLGIASILFIAASLLLKVSGLLRDMVIAYYFGDSYVADAYLAAFILPNMLILFMTTGMKNAFVPSYMDSLEQQRGRMHFGQILKGTTVISLILSVIGAALSPFIIPLLFPEFQMDAKTIAVNTAIIFFCSIVFVGINSVIEAYFDAENRFALSIVSQIVVLLSSIIGALLFAEHIGAYSLAFGYLIGTVISLIFKLLIVLPKKSIQLRGRFDWIEIRHFYNVFIPVGLTVAVGQINLMVGTMFASGFGEGAVTYINYAKNLVHMPQGIFGVTIATIIFPMLAKAITTDNTQMFKRGIGMGLNTMYFILLPSVVGMMILMPNIIGLLYERGAFTSNATMATSQVAYLYFGSVLFFSLNNVINKGFYSLKKGHMILFVSGVSVITNIIFTYIFTAWIGYKGIPLAASVNALFYVGISFVIFLKLINGIDLKKIVLEFSKITLATIVMGGIVWWISFFIEGLPEILHILLVAVIGAIIYIIVAYIVKIESFTFLIQKLLGKKAAEKEPSS